MEFQKFLKTADVADILKVSYTSAFKLMSEGEIPSVRIGHCIRVQESDLQEFINRNRIDSNKMSTGPFSSVTK